MIDFLPTLLGFIAMSRFDVDSAGMRVIKPPVAICKASRFYDWHELDVTTITTSLFSACRLPGRLPRFHAITQTPEAR